jgi:uncharacterized protein YndB with AHSA1/START domain
MAATNAGSSAGTNAAEQELVLTRVFDAPRDVVFAAWTQPDHFVRWWGPKDCSTPFCELDVRPGGTYRYCMRTPERDVWVKGVYREVVEPERLVYTSTFTDPEGNAVEPSYYGLSDGFLREMLTTVTFIKSNGGTELTIRQLLGAPSSADREGTAQGWGESLDRLAALVAEENV